MSRYDCDGQNFVAYLGGSIYSANQYTAEEIAEDAFVRITGDGDYSVTWKTGTQNAPVNCLFLQTNINYLAFGSEEELMKSEKERSPEDCGVAITIRSIRTGKPDETV